MNIHKACFRFKYTELFNQIIRNQWQSIETMIVDDVEEFLKFLDDVSFQLACLLDIDEPGQQRSAAQFAERGTGGVNNGTTKKVYNRRKESHRKNKPRSNQKSKNEISIANSITNSNKRQPTKLQQSTRTRGKRKLAKLDDLLDDISHTNSNTRLTTCLTNDDSDALLGHHNQQNHLSQQQQQTIHTSLDGQQQQLQSNKLQQQHSTNSINPTNLDAHTLDVQLTLNIADELPLDHATSISPTTHLSPMDSTIQFSNLHSQHYYTPPQRGVGHLDSYHLHDDFTASHDQIPITNQTQNLNQDQHIVNHQHLINHHTQPTSILRVDSLADVTTAINNNDCYQHPNHIPHHHHHHHHHPHPPQYHQLDQQWLAATPHSSDNTLQLGQTDSGALDHVVPISPTSHQSLDQVQFNTPIYHHSYYNHQIEHLESFHQMTDDYATNPGPAISVSSSSPLNHLRRMQQDQQQQQHQQHHHHSHNQHQSVLRMSTLDLNNSNSINGSSNNSNNNNNNNYDPHQIHHHQHNQQQQQHTLHSQPEHQIHGLNQSNSYNNNSNHNQTSHHQQNQHLNHHQHQMLPLMNGLVEPSGVIIQDINLAAATWSSTEDLYSI